MKKGKAMGFSKTFAPTTAFQENEPFDASVGPIGFVVHRDPNRNWEIVDVASNRYHVLGYAIAGRANYRCADESFVVSKGHLVFFPKGCMHSAKSDLNMPWSFFSVAFDLQYADPHVEEAIQGLSNHAVVQNTTEMNGLFNELERSWVSRELGFLLQCRSIILRILHIYVRICCGETTSVSHGRRLAPIVAMLQSNRSWTFSIEKLAAMAELSPSRFRVLFRAYTGHSVVEYQNKLRVNRAKDLLLSGEYSVTEAARETGFLDVFYFSRLFKKLTGYNPSYFRNQ